MHPEIGMGVQFTRTTVEQRNHVEKFIHTLMNAGDLLPELFVEPEGLETSHPDLPGAKLDNDVEDPLLELFDNKASLSAELFLKELKKQRRSQHPDASEESILPV
jgi:hypothetical protein